MSSVIEHLVNEEPGVLYLGPAVYRQPLVGTEGLLGVRGLGVQVCRCACVQVCWCA